jgi:hypothetical protein
MTKHTTTNKTRRQFIKTAAAGGGKGRYRASGDRLGAVFG